MEMDLMGAKTRAEMPPLGRERPIIEIKQELDVFLESESHMHPGGACSSERLNDEEQSDECCELKASSVKIKKEPMSEAEEFSLGLGDPESPERQGDDKQSEAGDEGWEKVEIKIEQELVKEETSVETFAKDEQSLSRCESQRNNTAPNRRRQLYQCHICSAEYGNVIQLTSHAKTHHMSKDHSSKVKKCRSCCKVLSYSPTKDRKRDLCKKCSLCGKCSNAEMSCSGQSGDAVKEDNHVTMTTIESCLRNVFQPKSTSAETSSFSNKKHVTQTFTCLLCGQIFVSADALEKHHINSHEAKKKFTCKVCKKKCSNQSSLNSHIKDKHTVAKPFICQVCGKSYYKKSHLEEHMSLHSGEKAYQCELCGQKFRIRRSFSRHKKNCTIHSLESTLESSNSNIWACKHCLEKFTDSADLTKHSREHHSDKFQICELCNALFTAKSSLAMHYRVHTGYKPNVCRYCEKSFSRGSHLKIHERLHTGEKPFNCDKCGRSFKRRDHLKSHSLRIHDMNGEVRKKWPEEVCMFVCKEEGCGKRYYHSSQLRRHKKDHK